MARAQVKFKTTIDPTIWKVLQRSCKKVAYETAREIRDTMTQDMFIAPKHGRRYIKPWDGTVHIASKAGEPPAVWSGEYSKSLKFNAHMTKEGATGWVGSKNIVGVWLEESVPGYMEARPHFGLAFEHGRTKIKSITRQVFEGGG